MMSCKFSCLQSYSFQWFPFIETVAPLNPFQSVSNVLALINIEVEPFLFYSSEQLTGEIVQYSWLIPVGFN